MGINLDCNVGELKRGYIPNNTASSTSCKFDLASVQSRHYDRDKVCEFQQLSVQQEVVMGSKHMYTSIYINVDKLKLHLVLTRWHLKMQQKRPKSGDKSLDTITQFFVIYCHCKTLCASIGRSRRRLGKLACDALPCDIQQSHSPYTCPYLSREHLQHFKDMIFALIPGTTGQYLYDQTFRAFETNIDQPMFFNLLKKGRNQGLLMPNIYQCNANIYTNVANVYHSL